MTDSQAGFIYLFCLFSLLGGQIDTDSGVQWELQLPAKATIRSSLTVVPSLPQWPRPHANWGGGDGNWRTVAPGHHLDSIVRLTQMQCTLGELMFSSAICQRRRDSRLLSSRRAVWSWICSRIGRRIGIRMPNRSNSHRMRLHCNMSLSRWAGNRFQFFM